MLHLNKGLTAVGIPFVLAAIAVIKQSVAVFVIFIIAHFLILKIVPAFKRRENIGMFVIVAVSSIPINIYIFRVLFEMELLFDSFFFLNILRVVFYYIVLLSIEEVIMGVLTRLIYKKQDKLIV